MNGFEKISDDLTLNILYRLELVDLYAIAQASKTMKRLCLCALEDRYTMSIKAPYYKEKALFWKQYLEIDSYSIRTLMYAHFLNDLKSKYRPLYKRERTTRLRLI
jgi:hypothetical protein